MMKKVFIATVIFIATLTSCTDNTEELEQRIENAKQIELQLVDPSDNGEIEEEERREE